MYKILAIVIDETDSSCDQADMAFLAFRACQPWIILFLCDADLDAFACIAIR